jgi:thiamine-phosphate pyrophosphorylase
MEPDCLLYLISPPRIDDAAIFAQQLRAAYDEGGDYIGAFQLRLKAAETVDGRLTKPAAKNELIQRVSDVVRPICHEYGVSFLMNDSAELAKICGADGVHLGQEDGAVPHARAFLGEEAVIGVTCHASRHLAMEAGEAGADYVAFGAFYPTTSKSAEALAHWGTPDPEILQWWSTHTILPCAAIGGITPENAAPLIEAGADFIAVISSIWQHFESPALAVRAFVTILENTTRLES